jgi:hypothetical protein
VAKKLEKMVEEKGVNVSPFFETYIAWCGLCTAARHGLRVSEDSRRCYCVDTAWVAEAKS